MATGTLNLPVLGGVGDPTNPPGLAFTAANRPHLLFDADTDELVLWVFQVPANYASGPLLKLNTSAVSATTGDQVLAAQVMAVGDNEDIDTDNFDTANTSTDTVAGTAGLNTQVSITLTNDGAPTALAAGDMACIRLFRDISLDGVAGDVEVWDVAFEYTTS